MGVSYYVCPMCGETYPDCCSYGHCTGCETDFCDEYCGGIETVEGETNKWGEQLTTCHYCRGEAVTDEDFTLWLCMKLGKSQDDLYEECVNETKSDIERSKDGTGRGDDFDDDSGDC